jgi:trans-o-hydroxybenzylidenepyruvate hydratase-aldolase
MPKKRSLLTVDEVQGAWAIVPTPAKEGSESWKMEDTVDVGESARAVDALISSGVDGILSMGTLGECATLTWDEKRKFMAAIVEAAAGRVPVFVGTTTLNTRDTVRETREAADLGADGTMLGLPLWCPPRLGPVVSFYRDVAEACPDMAIAVYANAAIFRFEFPPPFWAQLASIPQVVAAKVGGIGRLLMELDASQRRIRLMPVDFDYYAAARMDPEACTAFWSTGAVCGPEVVTALRDEVEAARRSGDWGPAKALVGRIQATYMTLFPNGSFDEFSAYNVALEKERMNAAGWMKAGPPRPPYHVIPEPFLDGARASGRAWAELARECSSKEGRAAGGER